MKGKLGFWAIGVLVVMLLGVSFAWWYTTEKRDSVAETNSEMAALQTTFVQQYGSQVTIKQLVSPDKVYAALWSDSEGNSHVSWNVGGLWVTVWNSPPPVTP